eukprot:CAMPEP_0115029802 /NCGR_PEP_ID=MMETSP0216-20121206/37272_1 /TAXON_ID=223996 /ORGANISM="Protocruzia adherens, Strain Boccale" /LENGTH=264 /DNA_ID=CAMNT_0002406565 /DNA_START=128 /DNA_END=922 /DNA_ORIENTATION=+
MRETLREAKDYLKDQTPSKRSKRKLRSNSEDPQRKSRSKSSSRERIKRKSRKNRSHSGSREKSLSPGTTIHNNSRKVAISQSIDPYLANGRAAEDQPDECDGSSGSHEQDSPERLSDGHQINRASSHGSRRTDSRKRRRPKYHPYETVEIDPHSSAGEAFDEVREEESGRRSRDKRRHRPKLHHRGEEEDVEREEEKRHGHRRHRHHHHLEGKSKKRKVYRMGTMAQSVEDAKVFLNPKTGKKATQKRKSILESAKSQIRTGRR